jgi:hypothetical protein
MKKGQHIIYRTDSDYLHAEYIRDNHDGTARISLCKDNSKHTVSTETIRPAIGAEPMPESDRKIINGMLHDISTSKVPHPSGGMTAYKESVPLDQIFDGIKKQGYVPLMEDNTEWSGILCGADGQMNCVIAKKAPDHDASLVYEGHTKVWLHLQWHKMQSGRYEINAYTSREAERSRGFAQGL